MGGSSRWPAQEDPLARGRALNGRRVDAVSSILILALAACASPGVPPGGPERHIPPMITSIKPDTNSVGARSKDLVIHFDEVVSEHPASASSLNDLVLISPRNGAPRVDWHRSSISIRPSKGWKANTTYTVTLLPGVADLRGNIRTTPTVVTFSTGASIPNTLLGGTIFDWMTGLPSNTAIVEAHILNDTNTVYLAASDSIGHYSMRGLPVGQYEVRGYIDANRNRALDPSEAFDTSAVYLKDTLNLELLAFAHDSIGPKLASAAVMDSVTIRATFDTPLDPRIPLATSQFAVVGSDSARLAVVSVKASYPDTARQEAAPPPVAQSAIPIPQRRTVKAPMVLPKPTRPLLIRDVVIVVATPLRAGATYRLTAMDATNPSGKKLTSEQTFQVPKAAPRSDSTAAAKPKPTGASRPATRPANVPAKRPPRADTASMDARHVSR